VSMHSRLLTTNPPAADSIDDEERTGFCEWCIVELFGKKRAAGYITQAEFPAGWIRLEIPPVNGQPAATQLYNPSAIYAMHPVTEDLARRAASEFRPRPVSRYELPAPPPPPHPSDDDDWQRDPDDEDDEP
jgi:hypothetical protein